MGGDDVKGNLEDNMPRENQCKASWYSDGRPGRSTGELTVLGVKMLGYALMLFPDSHPLNNQINPAQTQTRHCNYTNPIRHHK
jgi:hypothetical protein